MENTELRIELHGVATEAAEEALNPTGAREICVLGPRGTGKSQLGLAIVFMHAFQHHAHGGELPVEWMLITGTHREHLDKLVPSSQQPHWRGAWQLTDGGRYLSLIVLDEERTVRTLAHCALIGLEDATAANRVRRECHNVWLEEPASAGIEDASGVSLSNYLLADSSRRLPTYRSFDLVTSNYPSETHWEAKRFYGEPDKGVKPFPNTKLFRIPQEQSWMTLEQRVRMEQQLAGRPDMVRRLVHGEFGSIQAGQPVAQNFSAIEHVSNTPLHPYVGEPLIIGWDGGGSPTAVILQALLGRVTVFAAFTLSPGGSRQLAEGKVLPWLHRHAGWAQPGKRDTSLIQHVLDPSMNARGEADYESWPPDVIARICGGFVDFGPTDWAGRLDPLFKALDMPGGFLIDKHGEGCADLIETLASKWHYRENKLEELQGDVPVKDHPWSDYGDSLCYAIAKAPPALRRTDPYQAAFPQELKVITAFDPMEDHMAVAESWGQVRW